MGCCSLILAAVGWRRTRAAEPRQTWGCGNFWHEQAAGSGCDGNVFSSHSCFWKMVCEQAVNHSCCRGIFGKYIWKPLLLPVSKNYMSKLLEQNLVWEKSCWSIWKHVNCLLTKQSFSLEGLNFKEIPTTVYILFSPYLYQFFATFSLQPKETSSVIQWTRTFQQPKVTYALDMQLTLPWNLLNKNGGEYSCVWKAKLNER